MKHLLVPFLVLTGLLSAASDKPNIVFLFVDDLGWGDFGPYGAEFYETPHIDQLAKDGMLFTNAYAACTVCSPSRAAVLTGRYPARTHLTDWITGHVNPKAKLRIPDWKMKMDHSRVLLPEALRENGYATGFFGKWHLMPIGQPDFDQHDPTHHGFDLNVGGREWGQPKGPGKYFSPFDMPGLDDGKKGDFLTDKLTDASLNFIDTNASAKKPFLLYFSYYTLHGPVMAPPALVQKYKEKAKTFDNTKNEHLEPRRAGMVEALDNSVGRIVAKLEEKGLSQNTIIVLTGDNGGNYDTTTGGLKNFKGFSHEGGTREPFIAKWPAKIAPGTTCHEMVIGTDLYPTFLDAACVPMRPEEHLDGLSILPLLTGKSKTLRRDTLYWHYPHYHRTKPYGAIRHGDWKLIEFFENGDLELYNLKADQNETTNLATKNPEKAQALLKKLRDWRKEVGAQMMTPNPDHDSAGAAKESKAPKKKKAAK
ncbi:MAG: sulfatase [Verrucomicrobiaceae bacterium]